MIGKGKDWEEEVEEGVKLCAISVLKTPSVSSSLFSAAFGGI